MEYKFCCRQCGHKWHQSDYPEDEAQNEHEIDYFNGMACPQCNANEEKINGTEIK
jgi:Zn finger protein HypA/HybF involved in hydrogenase expression